MADLVAISELLTRGRYADVIAAFEGGSAGGDGSASEAILAAARGGMAALEGRVDEAQQEFGRALELGGPDSVRPVALRFARQRRPGHWFLPPIKRALVSSLGPEAGAAEFAAMVDMSPGWRRVQATLTSLRDYILAETLTFDELIPAQRVTMPAPHIVGAEQGAPLTGDARSVFWCVIPDVVICAKSNLLVAGDAALLDYQDDELGKVPLDLDIDPIVLARHERELTLILDAGTHPHERLSVAMPLVGVHTYNFGHWLLEFLPRVLACRDRPGFEEVTLVVDEQMPPQHLEALRLVVGNDHPIVTLARGASVAIDQAWTCSSPIYTPLFPLRGASSPRDLMTIDAQGFARLLSRASSAFRAVAPAAARRIFLTRESSQHRAMVNKDEVEAWFVERGFELHDFGELAFSEQLALVRGAEVIVAPSGSSLMATFFARPGTRVGILNNPFLRDHEWYAAVCDALGQRLSILTGKVAREDPFYDYRADYEIDMRLLEPFLADLLTTALEPSMPSDTGMPALPFEAEVLLAACDELDAGKPAKVLSLIGERADEHPLTAAIAEAARAYLFEQEGDAANAAAAFERAYASSAPLPAVLRACGNHLKRTGDYERAWVCFARLEAIHPDTILEFFSDLPDPELLRFAPLLVKRLIMGRQLWHYRLMIFKRLLVERFGADGAALAYAVMANKIPGWEAPHLSVTSLHDYARTAALEYEVLQPALQIEMPAPPVFGDPPRAPLRARSRELFFALLEDAVVVSKSSFLRTGSRAVLDYQADELERVALDIDADPWVFAPSADELTLLIDISGVRGRPIDVALSLVGVHTSNFGHWLLEFLPHVMACMRRPGFDAVTLLVDEQMPPQHLEALRVFVGPDQPVRVVRKQTAVRVSRLWACSRRVYIPIHPTPNAPAAPDLMAIDAVSFAALLASTHDELDAIPRANVRRIFLTRTESQHRAMANKEAVEAWFVTRGFELHDFGELTFAEQVALVRGAEVVIAPSGSSLMMTFFARAGTRIGILNNPFLQDHEWYAAVCEALGQRLSILTGEVADEDVYYDYRADYEIDTGRLEPFLADLLAG